MLTLLLAVVLITIAVVGAELVRSTCRRQLMSAVAVSPQVAESRAAVD